MSFYNCVPKGTGRKSEGKNRVKEQNLMYSRARLKSLHKHLQSSGGGAGPTSTFIIDPGAFLVHGKAFGTLEKILCEGILEFLATSRLKETKTRVF